MPIEYPKWIYPPDGGRGHIIETPEQMIKGWLDQPAPNQAPSHNERIIGQPLEHVPTAPSSTAHVAPVIEEQPKKSKKTT